MEIIYLGQKACEICNGLCLDWIDIVFIIAMTLVVYKILESFFE